MKLANFLVWIFFLASLAVMCDDMIRGERLADRITRQLKKYKKIQEGKR
jgi:hypothetical protein